MHDFHEKMNEMLAWFGSAEPWGLWWLVINGLAVFVAWLALVVVAVQWHKSRARGSWSRKLALAVDRGIAAVGIVAMLVVAVWLIVSAVWLGAISLLLERPVVGLIQPTPPLWTVSIAAASMTVFVWAMLETRNRPSHDGLAGIIWWLREQKPTDPNDKTVELPVVAKV